SRPSPRTWWWPRWSGFRPTPGRACAWSTSATRPTTGGSRRRSNRRASTTCSSRPSKSPVAPAGGRDPFTVIEGGPCTAPVPGRQDRSGPGCALRLTPIPRGCAPPFPVVERCRGGQRLQCAHGPEDQRALRQLRRLRAGVPEPGDHAGRNDLRHRSGAVHRVRRPFRRTAVRGRVPGRMHRPGPGPPGKRTAAAGQAAPPAAGVRMNRILSLFLAAALLAAAPLSARDARADARPPGAAIASAHALATEAGFETLEAGGNAFDAAVTVSSVLSVVEPISSGLGGGGFFLLHDARSGKDSFIDAREMSPAAARPEAYLDAEGNLHPDTAENGPWSARLPGLPAARVELAQKHGRLPLAQSLAPAIRIAREGVPVYARLERGYASRREVMERYPGTRAVFLADGDPPKVGEILRQPDL